MRRVAIVLHLHMESCGLVRIGGLSLNLVSGRTRLVHIVDRKGSVCLGVLLDQQVGARRANLHLTIQPSQWQRIAIPGNRFGDPRKGEIHRAAGSGGRAHLHLHHGQGLGGIG